jgi:hypothetical protein
MNKATLAALCLLTGCFGVQSGQKFDVVAAKQIITGVTTKADVIKMFGSPPQRYAVAGVERWTYSYFGIEAHSTAIAFIPYAGPFLPGGTTSSGRNDSMTIGFSGEVVSSCVVSSTITTGAGSAINQSTNSTTQTVDCQAFQ